MSGASDTSRSDGRRRGGPEQPEPAVVVEGLTVTYPGQEEPSPRGLSLRVPRGAAALVLGPSGCGKSTLLHCLNGLIPHALHAERSGRVFVFGQGPAETDLARCCERAGLVFQDPSSQLATLSVADEAAFGPENLCLPPDEVRRRADHALRTVGLEGLRDRRPDQLSGGQQQRLALAAALALRPPLLLLDEPTANLDPLSALELMETLTALVPDQTIILVEHRAQLALPLCHHLVALDGTGSLLVEGPPGEALASRGEAMLDLGLWLPAPTEVALELRRRGRWSGGLPLTPEEAAEGLAALAAAGGSPAPEEVGLRREETGRAAAAARDLWFSHADGTQVLRGVSLEARAGEVLGLAGPNGSGKTTLALCLLGFLRPQQGEVRVGDVKLGPRSRRGLRGAAGMVFQNPEHQFLGQSVAEELSLGLRAARVPEGEAASRAAEALARHGLQGLEDRHPYHLSWGQKRRLSLAALEVLEQPLLVLDEPTFGQDRHGTRAILARIRQLAARGTAVVVISHDTDQLLEVCDRLVLLREGRVLAEGDPWSLLDDDALLRSASLTRPFAPQLRRRLSDLGRETPRLRSVREWLGYLAP